MEQEKNPTALDDFKNDLSEWLEQISFFLECRIEPEIIGECREALNVSLRKYHSVAVEKHNLPPSLFNGIVGLSRLNDILERIKEGWLKDVDVSTVHTMRNLVYAGMMIGSSFQEMGEEIKNCEFVKKAIKFETGTKKKRDKRTPFDEVLEKVFGKYVRDNGRQPSFIEFINSVDEYDPNNEKRVVQEIDYDFKKVYWTKRKDSGDDNKDTSFKTVRDKLTALKKTGTLKGARSLPRKKGKAKLISFTT